MSNQKKCNNNKLSKRPYVVAIILALALVITITATSYAYFVANVTGTSSDTVVTTAALEIEFTDGPQVSLENVIPGSYIEKTFKIENTSSSDTVYDVYMSDLFNNFVDKNDLVYTLTSSDGGFSTDGAIQAPSTSSKIIDNYVIREGETHNYTLKIEFKETNDNQDDNKGKSFSAIIRVNEYNDFEMSINYYVDGVKVDEYPNGTHRFLNASCNNGANITFDSSNWTYQIYHITQTQTICELNFEASEARTFDNTTVENQSDKEQTYVVPADGSYQLEVWGAQGGVSSTSRVGGFGGYSVGVVELKEGDILYINVGEKGESYSGGYNGGGNGGSGGGQYGLGGGGATHIATVSGLLSTLSENVNDILIVAGGGSGGGSNGGNAIAAGANAGGYVGNNGYDYYNWNRNYTGNGGTQNSGGSYCGFEASTNCSVGTFGQGGNLCNLRYGGAGGGGGFYGGAGSARGHASGGGGSSYIGNSKLLSYAGIIKHMTCNGCQESSIENVSTYTISNDCHSSIPESDCAKENNGSAKITHLWN